MVKAYLKYEQVTAFGVIASHTAAVVPVPNAAGVPLVASAAVDAVLIWNMRKGETTARLGNLSTRKAGAVTAIAVANSGDTVAAGYSDGSVRLWDLMNSKPAHSVDGALEDIEPIITFNGHRSGISSIAFEKEDASRDGLKKKKSILRPTRLVTGSNDGDVILWNSLEEAGIFRLAAHNDAVTSILLFKRANMTYLASSSKDGTIKVYDVATQHCVQTIVGHRAEVWAMEMDPSNSILVTGSADAELRAFMVVDPDQLESKNQQTKNVDDILSFQKETVFKAIGSVQRYTAAARVSSIDMISQNGETFTIVAGADKTAEIFRLRSAADAAHHKKRRSKRILAKIEREEKNIGEDEGLDDAKVQENIKARSSEAEVALEAKDYLITTRQLRMPTKLRSVSFLLENARIPASKSVGIELQFVVQFNNNALEIHKAPIIGKKNKKRKKSGEDSESDEEDEDRQAIQKLVTLDFAGHRGDVRSISLSPDDTSLLSTSRNALKLWNIATQKCIRTMEMPGYGLSTSFLGADARIGAVGTKEGLVSVYDLGSGSLITTEENAHKGPVWSMCLDSHIYDANCFITGGADKRVCFWGFEDVLVGSSGKLKLLRTLEMPDEVLCVRVAYGRDRPILLVAMMDSTVRAFFLDTLDPYLSFYGHRLPVMSMDVSTDGLMLVTGSADKTMKLWGMDFGDCRRSLRAHDDSVLSVAFQPKTHYIFSGSRDGTLKYWDGDKFEFIAALDGQRGELWSLVVSDDGELVASASHDRMMRVWRRTDEPVFLEEELDKRMDEMFESTLIDEDLREASKARSKVVGFMEDNSKGEATTAGKRSLETVKGGERLLEALKLCDEEQDRLDGGGEDGPNPMMLGMSPEAYMLRTLEGIKAPDLEEALHMLPLDAAMRMLEYCNRLLGAGKSTRLSGEMLARASLYLIKLHHSQIVGGAASRKLISELRERLDEQLVTVRQRMGFNMAALNFWQTELADRDDRPFRDAEARAFNLQKRKVRRVASLSVK